MIKHYQYEIDCYKRVLNFITNENIYLKDRLTEILKESFDNKLLDGLEHFYELFLKKDDLINFLRNEIAEIEKAIEKTPENIAAIINKLERIDNNIQAAEKHFYKLKKDFTTYLAKNICINHIQH